MGDANTKKVFLVMVFTGWLVTISSSLVVAVNDLPFWWLFIVVPVAVLASIAAAVVAESRIYHYPIKKIWRGF